MGGPPPGGCWARPPGGPRTLDALPGLGFPGKVLEPVGVALYGVLDEARVVVLGRVEGLLHFLLGDQDLHRFVEGLAGVLSEAHVVDPVLVRALEDRKSTR